MTLKHFFDEEYDKLRQSIIVMGTEVEQQLYRAIDAFLKYDEPAAERVISYDQTIDRMEVDVDDLCVKLFAKLQPIAYDLRFLTAVVKINNDFERIGDQAVGIARHSLYLAPRPRLTVDLSPMAALAKEMVHRVVDALVNNSTAFAEEVLVLEERMDKFEIDNMSRIVSVMKGDPKNVKRGVSMIFITRCLEKAGDLAVNVAEDVIFYMNAKDIRHAKSAGEVPRKDPELP